MWWLSSFTCGGRPQVLLHAPGSSRIKAEMQCRYKHVLMNGFWIRKALKLTILLIHTCVIKLIKLRPLYFCHWQKYITRQIKYALKILYIKHKTVACPLFLLWPIGPAFDSKSRGLWFKSYTDLAWISLSTRKWISKALQALH